MPLRVAAGDQPPARPLRCRSCASFFHFRLPTSGQAFFLKNDSISASAPAQRQ